MEIRTRRQCNPPYRFFEITPKNDRQKIDDRFSLRNEHHQQKKRIHTTMPKVKNQHFVIMYTPESFVKKREKGERLEFTKILIASTDIGTITNKQKALKELQGRTKR